ncbi:26S proteasome regulatory subunit 7 [Stylosanthes scabra]|uniref:26S proteasome regulatory subunit 7 n=1 Tax=Stylosanthes scabra TaxID=79078 RepID=A0ABU6XCW9_9FABA|nr:26S proteasome regulatory subunit 7 [Stylosanthes scabra]
MMQEEQPLQVARCTKIINSNSEDAKYVINVKQIAKKLGEQAQINENDNNNEDKPRI